MNGLARLENRKSGIELLKIVAMFMIVMSHVVQTVGSKCTYIDSTAYVLDLTSSTNNLQLLLMSTIRYFGAFGDWVFFICSAWFWIESDNVHLNKLLHIIVEVWSFSVAALFLTNFVRGGGSKELMREALLPNTFATNWYITAYLIFCPLHSVLNKVIRCLTQKQLLYVATTSTVLYILCGMWNDKLFFSSTLIIWCTVYFDMAYIKIYCRQILDNIKINKIIFALSTAIFMAGIVLTNILGLANAKFEHLLLRWNGLCNPLIIIIAIALFNIFRMSSRYSCSINNISKYTLLIYIIHENLMIRSYLRPLIWLLIYENLGYDWIIVQTIVFSIALFSVSFALAIAYTNILKKPIGAMTCLLEKILRCFWGCYEKMVFMIH